MLNLVVPTGWKLTKLSDLGEVSRGRSRHRPRDAKHLYGGSYPFVQTGDVKASGGRINSYTQTYSEAGLAQSRLWPKGTMCITIAANIAETGILEFPACFPDSVIGFIPDPTKCNVYFIEYVFRFLRKRIQAQATGSVQDNINLQTLELLEFPVPEVEEQNRIASILCKFDDKIHLNTQTNQTLESIAQAIFKSWFVDFEPVKAKMAVLAEGGTREQAELAAMGAISGKGEAELAQLQQQNPEHYQQLAETAALFPSAMVESELGEIPEGWEVGSIGDIALAKGGYAFKSNEFEATGNKVVKIKNITGDGRVDLTDCDCVKHPQPEKLDRFKITNGDLLMAMTGATVGKIGIAVSGNDYVYLNQRVAKFESKIQTKKVSWFLFPCIQQKSIFDTIVGSAQGSAQPNISSTEIERTEIVVPDENLISKYCDLVDPFFKKWMANNILNIELANLRDSLLPKLLSGEIDLSDIQSEVA